MPRPSNTEARRQAIVAATERVIGERGFSRASVVEIARRAGLAPGLIHYHFGSKLEILLDLVTTLDRRVAARIASVTGVHPTPWQRVETYVRAHLGKGEGEDPTAVRCWTSLASEAASIPEVGQVYRDAMDRRTAVLRELLAEVADAEGRDRRSLLALAAMGQAAIEGAFGLAGAASGVIPQGSAARTLLSMLRGALDRLPPRRRRR